MGRLYDLTGEQVVTSDSLEAFRRTPTPDDKPERELCLFANKGKCHSDDDESHAPKSAAPKTCLNGIRCLNADCPFQHPDGWNDCANGVKCTNYDCICSHPPRRPAKCRYENSCKNNKYKFLHPNRSTHNVHAPAEKETAKIIELSDAAHNFLKFFGEKILDNIRKEQGIKEANFNDGKLQLSGKSSSIRNIESSLENTLHQQNVTIPNNLWIYLQLLAKASLWQKFLQKYHVGYSFIQTAANADQAEDDQEEEEEEDADWDDSKSDVSNAPSHVSAIAGNDQKRLNPNQKFVQVTICSDSKDLLSKATNELRSYSLFTTSWILTQNEIAFILNQAQKGKPSQGAITFHKQTTQTKSYLISTVRSIQNSITSIFVVYKAGVWRVRVRGFQLYVNKAVSKIKTHLNDAVETEVQIPISRAMAMFLRTKGSSDIQKLERGNSVKIAIVSKKRRQDVNDEQDDDKNCLKITGSNSRIDSGKMSVENFLESLSEQEKHFDCDSWDASKAINQIILERVKKIQDSHDYEAVGLIKFYTTIERRETSPKVTVSVVGINEEAADSVVQQCQDTVEGYVIWKPSADEYSKIVKALFVKKSPPLDEFRQQWDTGIRLDRDKSTITITARSKMIADDIKEALLGLGDEQKSLVTRVSEFIPIPPNIRRFVNQAISSLLDEAKSQKIFLESKNSNGLKLHGTSDKVTELKQKINVIIDDIKQKLIISRSQLSSAESDLMQANQYELAKRIERKTNTVIWIAETDKTGTVVNANETDMNSTIIAVVNTRGQTIVVKKGDITKATNVDAIVNAANGQLYHAGGIDKVIADAAGPALDQECKQLIAKNDGLPIAPGKAVKTTAGNLPFKCVIHAIGPQYTNGNQQERPLLFFSVLSSLRLAEDEGYRSIALPAISSHTYGFPLADCTNIIVRAVKQFFADYPQSKIKKVILLDMDDAACNSFAREVIIDHRDALVDDDTIMNYKLSPLTAKWCWLNDDGEKIYDENHTRQIEAAFQHGLKSSTISILVLPADNLKSGTIVNYSIHFLPHLKTSLASNPSSLNGRLVCGHQMRENTGFTRQIIRYPIVSKIQSTPVAYSPKPLDTYISEMVTTKKDWNITGISSAAVKQAELEIRKAIDLATITEPFSVNLNKDLDDHKREIVQIAKQQQIQVDFQRESSEQLSMILKGLKANVLEAKLKIALYAQDILKVKVDNDDELRMPKEWGDQKEVCKLVEINRNDPLFTRIENRMKETLNSVKIDKIERVQHIRMWNHYAFRRRELKKELCSIPDKEIEMELFHGTRTTLASEVYNGEYGFDMTYSTSGMWGIGTYFARNASYSCGSYAHQLPDGKRQVFLAQVLTGDVYDCKSDSTLRRPPKKNEAKSGLRYNSVSGDTGGSKVYIVYENRVAYPTYLITFT
ncbi:unnamed protein product [Rotaria socialis]|uniref:Poly [ADP-ribose] polymerase n=2 Tax=Rotaria socialis TaxID=392032 RepID=A0A820VCD8_9BILA|nr:unnamed protein product [Rotaria socialis]